MNKTRYLAVLIALLFGAWELYAQVNPYSNAVFPPFTATASGQSSTPVNMASMGPGGSYSTGTIDVEGVGLTTVTFGVMASSNGEATYYLRNLNPINSPSTLATTETVTSSGLYQFNLTGVTNYYYVTSGTFTATSVTFTLTASPNGTIARTGGGAAGP